jgi:hypothetical protein
MQGYLGYALTEEASILLRATTNYEFCELNKKEVIKPKKMTRMSLQRGLKLMSQCISNLTGDLINKVY